MLPLAEAKKGEIILNLPPTPIESNIWKRGIEIAFRNLLDNAIKYSFDQRPIQIYLRTINSKTVELIIRNYGVGIPEDRKEIILREGERGGIVDPLRPANSRPGTGQGLPIAVDYIHRHGGTLDIQCEPPFDPNKAAKESYKITVTVTLPLFKGKLK